MRDAGVRDDRVFVDVCRLRRSRAHAARRTHADAPDQPVRRVEAGLRARAEMVSPAHALQGRLAPVLQRGRGRAPVGRAPRAGNASDSARARRGGWLARQRDDLRRRLPDARRHVRSRLHSRARSRRRACARDRFSASATSRGWKSTTWAAAATGTRFAR